MKAKILALFAVVLCSGLLYLGWSQYSEFLHQGQSASESTLKLNKFEQEGVPPIKITDTSGQVFNLADHKDKVVILNFWASWCDPCVEEFPSMQALIKEMQGKVILLAVSADYNEEDMNNFLKAFKVADDNIIVAWDKDQKLAREYGTEVLPESYIIGKNNKLVKKIVGIDKWDTPEAIKFFEFLSEQKE